VTQTPAAVVFVVDDDPSVRRALPRLLRSAGYAVETFERAEDLLLQQLPNRPACAILDVGLPGMDGFELQSALAERSASLPVIFITGQGDIPRTVRAMKAGAMDFLAKPFEDSQLLQVVGEAVAKHALSRHDAAEREELRRRAGELSPREREVMELVVQGMLNKQVGHRLGIAEKTVKVHRAGAMRKMHAASLAELVLMARRLAE